MQDKLHDFSTGTITVTWSKRRCIHAAECVAGLPRVFQPGERPWVKLDRAGADAVAEVVRRCPTGALHDERHDGGAAEVAPATNTVHVRRNGPTYLHGELEIRTPEGEVLLRDTRLALCRCGASGNMPLCDNAHLDAGFRDAGAIASETSVEDADATTGSRTLVVTPRADGPIELRGPFELHAFGAGRTLSGSHANLCRCGQSENKPFCDGSHKRVGFTSR